MAWVGGGVEGGGDLGEWFYWIAEACLGSTSVRWVSRRVFEGGVVVRSVRGWGCNKAAGVELALRVSAASTSRSSLSVWASI